jgi:nucleoside-diphosphate-sugar epimerase
MHAQLLILGCGYTGRFLVAEASGQGRIVLSTSRDPDRQLTDFSPSQRLMFDLARPDTWTNIRTDADLIWCFPAAPVELVRAFTKTLDAPPRRLVVLGSTSAYDGEDSSKAYPPPWIDESAPIDVRKPRVQGEEFLRNEHGATVLRIAGIYGPGRNPLDWIRSGRVGPSRKYVNLIHVEDLARICLLALENSKPGEVYNVSDGTPRTWADICRVAQTRWGIAARRAGNDNRPGKRIKTIALREKLGATLRHPDLYAELDRLESRRG